MSVRGAVFGGDGTWQILDFPDPVPPAGGAVLRVDAVGLCHSDVSQLHGHHHVPGEVSPVVPGHEIVGTVHELAADADLGVEIGDRVAVDLVRFGEPSEHNPLGLHIYGYTRSPDDEGGLWGGYAEYMSIAAGTHLARLDTNATPEEQTIFEALSSCINWLDHCSFGAGQRIVIQGPGHMGLACTAAAAARGAELIVVTGTDSDALRLDTARRVGAHVVINIDETDPVAAVHEITGGAMADLAVDLANASTTPGLCFDLVRFGGTVLWAGLKDRAAVPVISDDVVTRSLTIRGGSGGTATSVDAAVRLLNSGDFPMRELLGEIITLDQIDHAMAILERRADHDAVRVVLRHDHG